MSKQDPGTKVSREAFRQAMSRYQAFTKNYKTSGRGSFASFLGCSRLNCVLDFSGATELTLRKSAVDKIMLLNEQHWYTILKVIEVRKHP